MSVQGLKDAANEAKSGREAAEKELGVVERQLSGLDDEARRAALHYLSSTNALDDGMKNFFDDLLVPDPVVELSSRVRHLLDLMRVAKTCMEFAVDGIWRCEDVVPEGLFALSMKLREAPAQVYLWKRSSKRERELQRLYSGMRSAPASKGKN